MLFLLLQAMLCFVLFLLEATRGCGGTSGYEEGQKVTVLF